ncbi:MAG: AlbA family DNA-binding domain-containing protein [Bradyrhizobium sp.]
MLKLDTEDELIALYIGNVKEGLYLEYKASEAVDKRDDKKKLEIARDVSAFANSMGGQIVYAMTEIDHEPAGLDEGIDPKTYTTIWFEQILQQHVTPNLVGLKIDHIPLASGKVAVRIDVPAGSGDPHQVSDGKYYRRHNFNRLAMDHYEIKGLFYRTTTPDLFLNLSLSPEALTFPGEGEKTPPAFLALSIGNRSNQPAFHTVVKIGVDAIINAAGDANFTGLGQTKVGNVKLNWVTRSIMTPPSLPIFREAPIDLGSLRLRFDRNLLVGAAYRFRIATVIQTPGQFLEENWTIHLQDLSIRLLEPQHPFAR